MNREKTKKPVDIDAPAKCDSCGSLKSEKRDFGMRKCMECGDVFFWPPIVKDREVEGCHIRVTVVDRKSIR